MKKTVFALLCAVGIVCGGVGAAAQESGNYKETVYPLAKSAHEQKWLRSLTTQADGGIDYFAPVQVDGEYLLRTQFHSGDGGKTWQEVDMGWLDEIREQAQNRLTVQNKGKPAYEQRSKDHVGELESVYLTDGGTVYACIPTEIHPKVYKDGQGEDVHTFDTVRQIFKVENGKAQAIVNLRLGEAKNGALPMKSVNYRIVEAEDGRIILALQHMQAPGAAAKSSVSFEIYDEASGKLLSSTPEIEDWNFSVSENCANGKAYAFLLKSEGMMHSPSGVGVYDAATGKLTQSIPLPAGMKHDDPFPMVCGAKDGTVYLTAESGLYRAKPGSKEFEKLLDGSACTLGKNALPDQIACTEDGKVFLTIRQNLPNSDQGKLYCYSPNERQA